ncbi:FMN-dependent NADH-azoreductase [Wenzhouxiangella sp. XN79A]|uniref:FMN-dependent NADH-azoreductase n=1 Tax=Wenzhouxiangella sp. XN79A TaxID=2724193 RepID=UPI00144ADFB3|nr:NAD(P)H-dependent oxidoreductase [Wenzhouxiangella sp. XN79A]NKI34421.1 FMN-dependent NADH-azoreductase [Wenzhouxiangella sp. XN79A]
MTHVLLITSSLNGTDGHSSRLAARYIDELRGTEPDLTVTHRDLAADPPPHLDGATFRAFATPAAERDADQRERTAWSDRAIAELQAADLVVIAAPMYNFGVPSVLKSWMDHVARAGITFRYTENGPEGLLTGRRAVVVSTRGGRYAGTPADSHTPFVETFLGFLGLGPVEFVHAEGLAMGEDRARSSLEQAGDELARLAA